MAKPVIVTDVDGSPEVVKHQETGIVIPPADPLALAQAMLILLEDKERARRYGENGRTFAKENFDINLQVGRTEELYTKLVEKKGL